ncbi:MAG: leucine-rich repeat protein [Clostridia bacterium]|nr:leucine-rich repeat protein [Clostridia bacterium]
MKKALPVFLALVITICSVVTVTAAESGTCGDTVNWSYTSGTLYISGSGRMDNFSSETVPWGSFKRDIKTVIISDNVTSIGNYAFYFANNLTDIRIPDSVEIIGNRAFYHCNKLRKISLNGVRTIGESAFGYCNSFTSITLPSGISTIPKECFIGCEGLNKVSIPTGVTAIGDSAFRFCNGLTTVYFPANIMSIGCNAFDSTSLSDVYFNGASNDWNNVAVYTSTYDRLNGNEKAFSKAAFHFESSQSGDDTENTDPSTITLKLDSCHKVSLPSGFVLSRSEKGTDIYDSTDSSYLVTVLAVQKFAGAKTETELKARISQAGYTCFSTINPYVHDEKGAVIQEGDSLKKDMTVTCYLSQSTSKTTYFVCLDFSLNSSNYTMLAGSEAIAPALGTIMTIAEGIQTSHKLTNCPEEDSTCSRNGHEEYWSCENCGMLFEDAEAASPIAQPVIIAKKEHRLTAHGQVDASCMEEGHEAYWECSVCEKLFSDEGATKEIKQPVVIPLAEHDLTKHSGTEASCKATGIETYWECSVCNKYFSDEAGTKEIEQPKIIPLAEHTMTKHSRIEASCKETGTEEYWECEVCGKLFADADTQEEIEKPVIIPLREHTLEYKRMVLPTYDKEGLSEGIYCSVCGKVLQEQEVLPKLEKPLPGDVNGDHVVDGRDVIRLMKWLADDPEEEDGEGIYYENADVDASGFVDEKDLLRLIRYLAGEDVTLEVGYVSGNG